MSALASTIAAARRFTRFFSREAELLDERLLGSGLGLTEARVLFELAHRGRPTAAELARDLRLDPGYLSRILKRFAAGGLLRRVSLEGDTRRSVLGLTEAGRDAFGPLDRASRDSWSARLGSLSAPQRRELVDAMATIEKLLGPGGQSFASGSDAIRLREHRVGDLGWIAHRQGLLYAAEYGFDASFEALVAEILVGFARERDPARERAWIAERDGVVLGSVFLMRDTEAIAKLRLLYVEPEARGEGLGRRLVRECVGFARAAGYRTLTLWTNDCLHAARRIYKAEGFQLVAEARHRSFGQELVGQTWELALAGPA